MSTVHNPTKFPLLCAPLARVIQPKETVDVTDSQASQISRSVFVVKEDKPSPAPARTTGNRGTKPVEETGAPERETR